MLRPCTIADPRITQVVLEHEVLVTVPVATEVKGVLFSLHGCLQLTKEWGFPSETCPESSGKSSSSSTGPHLCTAAHDASTYHALLLPKHHPWV